MEKIEEGKNWIIADEIEKFGKNIFNENYLEKEPLIHGKICDKTFMESYRNNIIAIKQTLEDRLRTLGKNFLELISNDGLDLSDFKQKSKGVSGFFKKLSDGEIIAPNSYVLKCVGNASEWLSSKAKEHLIDSRYLELVDKATTLSIEAVKHIATTNAILSHINHLMMLDMITSKVRMFNQEENRFLLADTARFLHDMIDDSDIPFIYERTGNRYKHIMIDEFQDTSAMQWENFKPLLENSLSQNQTCLLVGDVKQSIYRWRNSDWNILNSIQDGEMTHKIDHSTINKLDTNHRSLEEVVEFNNEFFMNSSANVAKHYDESCRCKTYEVEKAYNSVKQKVYIRNKGKGYVSVCDIKTSKDSGYDYNTLTLENIKNTIDKLINNNICANDIAILVREKKQIETICMYFANNKSEINIISEDAYKLCSSSAVNIIVTALTCIANPNDLIARLSLAYLYQTEVLDNKMFANDLDSLLCKAAYSVKTDETEKTKYFAGLLPPSFENNIPQFTVTPLAELAEQIYEIFELKKIKNQDAYLFSFYDRLTTFLQSKSDDINQFVKLWNENIKDTTVPSNSLDGIRIMTIHKSKGLEFHTVVVPFCHWSMGGRSDNLLWCQPNEAPYNKLPLTPVNYTKVVQNSIFKKDYDAETLKCYVDNLNLLYVAFTRAESNLIVFTGKKRKDYSINDVIMSSLPQRMHATYEDIKTIYTSGKLVPSSKVHKKKEEEIDPNVITRTPTPLNLEFTHYSSQPEFRQSNDSKRFIGTDFIEESTQFIEEGNIVHSIFERIQTMDDVSQAILKVEFEGIFKDEKQKNRIVNLVYNALENAKVQEWFAPKWKVLNERSILAWDSEDNIAPIRPDRVITDGTQIILIDYKTGRHEDNHIKQMLKYIKHLKQFYTKDIKAYLWYVTNNEIIPV
jgi:ATP-dependent exoDNAse (exonuclease V) beta subunit